MSSTRRTILRGLVLSPMVLAIPVTMLPSATDTVPPDAALIDQAAAVEALARIRHAALITDCERENRTEELFPISSRPKHLSAAGQAECTVTRQDDGTVIVQSIARPADPATILACEERKAAIKAWDAERKVVARRVGHDAASRKYRRLSRRLEIETRKLTTMSPTTVAGASAKARAAIIMTTQTDDYPAAFLDWEHDVRTSALRDMAAIGDFA